MVSRMMTNLKMTWTIMKTVVLNFGNLGITWWDFIVGRMWTLLEPIIYNHTLYLPCNWWQYCDQTSVLMNPRVTLIDNYMDDFDQAQLLPIDSTEFLRAITALHGSSTLGQTSTPSCTSSLLSTGTQLSWSSCLLICQHTSKLFSPVQRSITSHRPTVKWIKQEGDQLMVQVEVVPAT